MTKNTDEATAFLASLPTGPVPLSFDFDSGSGLQDDVQLLAQRGYIGCLRFTKGIHPTGHIVVRLLPGRSPHECPIGMVHANDAITFAPAMKHFIAGRLAHADAADSYDDERSTKSLIDYSAALGSVESTQAVLAACAAAAKMKSKPVRCGMLWAAAGKFDPLFEALGAAWLYDWNELGKWLQTPRGKACGSHIADRLSVGHHTCFETGVDVSEPAWRVVMGDHVFDLGYAGIGRGPIMGSKQANALSYAVQFLRKQGGRDQRTDSLVWQGAQAAVDNPRYRGELHFDAARGLAATDAAGAYTQLANAARHAAQGKPSLGTKILGFALDLATANQWHTLAATLKLAQVQSRGATAKLTTAKKGRSARRKS